MTLPRLACRIYVDRSSQNPLNLLPFVKDGKSREHNQGEARRIIPFQLWQAFGFEDKLQAGNCSLPFDFFPAEGHIVPMIPTLPNKKRYQVFMDHALPAHFEFVADFAEDMEASQYAEKLHYQHVEVDVIIFDTTKNIMRLVLPGKKTLFGRSW